MSETNWGHTHCPECRKPLRDYHVANCSNHPANEKARRKQEIIRELRRQLVPNLDPLIDVVAAFVNNVEQHTEKYSGVAGNKELWEHVKAFKIRLEELK